MLFVCLLLCCDDLMVTSLLQSEVVFDELERLNEQYQQLNSAFEAQAKELSESQVCTVHQHTRCLLYSAGGIRELMVIVIITIILVS